MGLWVSGVSVIGASVITGLVAVALNILFQRLFLLQLREGGKFKLDSLEYVENSAASVFAAAANGSLMDFFKGTVVMNSYLRSLGARVGKRSQCWFGPTQEHKLLDVGEGVIISEGAHLVVHHISEFDYNLSQVSMRDGAYIGTGSIVLPGADVGKSAHIGDLSMVFKQDTIQEGDGTHAWAGLPVRSKKYKLEKKIELGEFSVHMGVPEHPLGLARLASADTDVVWMPALYERQSSVSARGSAVRHQNTALPSIME